ncbi:MAG: hypothetical protein H0T90_09935 [Gemmatimonadales bacterium]|nr:hypothetical protein [Gemmatimonadales bacterium]
MTPGRRYLLGVAAVGAGGAGLVLAVAEPLRPALAWGMVTGLVLQAPLGWWAVRSIGTERFVPIWGLGMLVRLTVVGVAGLAVLPALGWPAGPTLGGMVGVLVALLLVEGVSAMGQHSREDER